MKAAMGIWLLCGVLASVAHAEDSLPPQIVHEPCDQYKKGESFDIWARFYDDSPIFDPKVIYRVGGDTTWKNQPFNKEPGTDDFKATLRAKDLKGTLEYFIEAFDENGNGPARYGSQDAPVKVLSSPTPAACKQIDDASRPLATSTTGSTFPKVIAPVVAPRPVLGLNDPGPAPAKSTCELDDRPLYCEPVLWSAVGVVALAGAGAGAYFLFFNNPTNDPPGRPPQKVTLQVGAPDPTGVTLRFGGGR